MQLGWRRRVLAAVATAAGALALALVATGRGCAPLDSTPDGAARAFVEAARSGDRHAVWQLLGPESRAELEIAARAATDNVGGTRRFAPLDVLDVGAPTGPTGPTGFRVLERRGDQATVEIARADGGRDHLRAVRVRGRWRIELWTRGEAARPSPLEPLRSP